LDRAQIFTTVAEAVFVGYPMKSLLRVEDVWLPTLSIGLEGP
jgi:hypothetical protein